MSPRLHRASPIVAAVIALAFATVALARHATPASNQPAAQSAPSHSPTGSSGVTQTAPSAGKQTTPESNQAFLSAADEVLQQMSQILDLPIKHPLKKSLRSRDQIRAYLLKQESGDKDKAQRQADAKSLEAFGLIPKNFPLDSFMIEVLTDQIAGMYDPKAKEFYIADWIPVSDQREVMAHELTHALEDQSFHVDSWMKAARSNDDAELARESVSEGSALAAMIDYVLRDQHVGVRDLPDMNLLIGTSALSQMNEDPVLAKAPLYIRDSLMFPYLEGTSFSQQFLKAHTGWADLKLLFQNPPVSTQQIIHPNLYLRGVKPLEVSLPRWKHVAPKQWKLLDENVMGEFGLQEVLKQFLGAGAAATLAPAWKGDRYAVFDDSSTGRTPLVFRLELDSDAHGAQFFSEYSAALAKKYPSRTRVCKDSEFLRFQTDGGGVFLRCIAGECLDVEGASRETFDLIDRAIGWAPAPAEAAATAAVSAGHEPFSQNASDPGVAAAGAP